MKWCSFCPDCSLFSHVECGGLIFKEPVEPLVFSLLNPKAAEVLESPEIMCKRLYVYICIHTLGEGRW